MLFFIILSYHNRLKKSMKSENETVPRLFVKDSPIKIYDKKSVFSMTFLVRVL